MIETSLKTDKFNTSSSIKWGKPTVMGGMVRILHFNVWSKWKFGI